jgi:excisionase family DNA binding protein
MKTIYKVKKPTKRDQRVAKKSYQILTEQIRKINSLQPEIEIEETKEKIKIPYSALKLLNEILKAMAQGKLISIVPIATEVTTQYAAEMLGCSRPHLVKLLNEGIIAHAKVGKHRRIKYEDVLQFKTKMKQQQKKNIIAIMNADEELGLYDT